MWRFAAAVLAIPFAIVTPTKALGVPVPDPGDVPRANAFVGCTDSGYCPDEITIDDQTCGLVSERSASAGMRIRFGSLTFLVVVSGLICNYGDCGTIESMGARIILLSS